MDYSHGSLFFNFEHLKLSLMEPHPLPNVSRSCIHVSLHVAQGAADIHITLIHVQGFWLFLRTVQQSFLGNDA